MQGWDELSAQVSQATGMVLVQADCSADEALVLLKDYARQSQQTLFAVAAATIEKRIRFEPTT